MKFAILILLFTGVLSIVVLASDEKKRDSTPKKESIDHTKKGK